MAQNDFNELRRSLRDHLNSMNNRQQLPQTPNVLEQKIFDQSKGDPMAYQNLTKYLLMNLNQSINSMVSGGVGGSSTSGMHSSNMVNNGIESGNSIGIHGISGVPTRPIQHHVQHPHMRGIMATQSNSIMPTGPGVQHMTNGPRVLHPQFRPVSTDVSQRILPNVAVYSHPPGQQSGGVGPTVRLVSMPNTATSTSTLSAVSTAPGQSSVKVRRVIMMTPSNIVSMPQQLTRQPNINTAVSSTGIVPTPSTSSQGVVRPIPSPASTDGQQLQQQRQQPSISPEEKLRVQSKMQELAQRYADTLAQYLERNKAAPHHLKYTQVHKLLTSFSSAEGGPISMIRYEQALRIEQALTSMFPTAFQSAPMISGQRTNMSYGSTQQTGISTMQDMSKLRPSLSGGGGGMIMGPPTSSSSVGGVSGDVKPNVLVDMSGASQLPTTVSGQSISVISSSGISQTSDSTTSIVGGGGISSEPSVQLHPAFTDFLRKLKTDKIYRRSFEIVAPKLCEEMRPFHEAFEGIWREPVANSLIKPESGISDIEQATLFGEGQRGKKRPRRPDTPNSCDDRLDYQADDSTNVYHKSGEHGEITISPIKSTTSDEMTSTKTSTTYSRYPVSVWPQPLYLVGENAPKALETFPVMKLTDLPQTIQSEIATLQNQLDWNNSKWDGGMSSKRNISSAGGDGTQLLVPPMDGMHVLIECCNNPPPYQIMDGGSEGVGECTTTEWNTSYFLSVQYRWKDLQLNLPILFVRLVDDYDGASHEHRRTQWYIQLDEKPMNDTEDDRVEESDIPLLVNNWLHERQFVSSSISQHAYSVASLLTSSSSSIQTAPLSVTLDRNTRSLTAVLLAKALRQSILADMKLQLAWLRMCLPRCATLTKIVTTWHNAIVYGIGKVLGYEQLAQYKYALKQGFY